MHQSIPAVPIPSPRATAGHLLTLSVPGVGHSQFYRSTGLGICVPRGDPRGDPRAFDTLLESAMDEFSGKDEAFVEHWLVRHGLEKLVDVFKRMFSQFWIFLQLLEIFNVKNKI